MSIRWVILVEGIDQWDFQEPYTGEDAYFVQALLQRGMMPVVRLSGKVAAEDHQVFVQKMHEYRSLGVQYFQIFNEPNRDDEWDPPLALSPRDYVTEWLPKASAVIAAGGFPGLGSFDPAGGRHDDLDFLRESLLELKRVEACDVLSHTWIGIHNYTTTRLDESLDYVNDAEGFALFRVYDTIAREVLGFSLPIIGTEGGIPGTRVEEWKRDTARMEALQAKWTLEGYAFMQQRPAYYFAFSPWIMGNLICDPAGEPDWEFGAFFDKNGGERPVAKILQGQ